MGGEIERKDYPARIKIDDASGTVTLYAAVFGNVDRQGEVIMPGAFKNLDQFVADGWLAVNHDWSEMGVASIDSASQDANGLLVSATYYSTSDAQDCRTIVKERMSRGKSIKCSIGYKVLEDEQTNQDGRSVRILKSIELIEASLVNLPANPLAHVSAVKGWWNNLDTAYAALKEGRMISTTNRGRLKKCRDQLHEATKDLDSILMETDPQMEPDEVPLIAPSISHGPGCTPGSRPPKKPKMAEPPASGSPAAADMMSVYFESLAICAKFQLKGIIS